MPRGAHVTPDLARKAIQARWSKPENVDLRIDALGERIRALVESAPPLTSEQVDRLRALLPAPTEKAGG